MRAGEGARETYPVRGSGRSESGDRRDHVVAMADTPVTRALYRGLLRSAKRLEQQAVRHGAKNVLALEDLHDLNVPSLRRALLQSEQEAGNVVALVRRWFRKKPTMLSESLKEVGARLDRGFAALALVNRRLGMLEKLAADPTSDETTNGIRVTVESFPVPERSSPRDERFCYLYKVRITNVGQDKPVQLVHRHWTIVDENGETEHVSGPGVVGAQPMLHKGQHFEYTSAAHLRTTKGMMQGQYAMITSDGQLIDVAIAPFALKPAKE